MSKRKRKFHLAKRFRLAAIVVLTFILLVIVSGFYLVNKKIIVPQADVGGPSLALSPASKQVIANETFNVDIVVDTVGQSVASVDIFRLNYDPQFLEVIDANAESEGVQIQPSSLFPVIYQNSVDSSGGKIVFNASKNIDGSGALNGSGTLATVNFRALKDGTANVNFDFTLGATNDSNLALDTSEGFPPDILAGVVNGVYTIGNQVVPVQSPTATATTPPGSGSGKKTATPAPIAPTNQPPTSAPTQIPTQVPTDSSTNAPINIIRNTPRTTSTPPPVVGIVLSPTISPKLSPSASVSPSGQFSPSSTPSVKPVTKIGGFSVLMINLLFYLGSPILIALIAYLIWTEVKRKKGEIGEQESSSRAEDEVRI